MIESSRSGPPQPEATAAAPAPRVEGGGSASTLHPPVNFRLSLATALLAAISLLMSVAGRAQAVATPANASTTTPAASRSAAVPDRLQQLKNPAPWFSWGADFRARNEYYNHIVTLAPASLHEQDLFRLRWRVAAALKPVADFSLNVRLTGEARQWQEPAFVGAFKARTGFEERYAIFDNFAAKWTNLLGGAGTFTLGRQDIMLGDPLDWWLVMDGTPNEGSWTTFFDAARLTVDAKSIKTKFDLIALIQNTQPDEWLPTIGSSTCYPLTDQRETGVIFYASNKSLPATQVDGYVLLKHDRQQTVTVAGVTKLSGDNADLYTLGGKVTGTIASNLQYSLEGALQSGTKEDRIAGRFAERDVRAWGGKARLTYSLRDPLNQQVTLTGEILSGDDPSTPGRDEMFDVLWGRWPLWSELYIYSVIQETGGRVAQMNNLGRFGGGWSCKPGKGTSVSLAWNALFALEQTPTRAVTPALFSRAGNFRGHYVQAVVKHQFNAHLSGHLWLERVWQGNFYTHREALTFLRAELMTTF